MIEPSQTAIDIADRILEDVDMQSDVIEETIESAETEGVPFESGRTVCGSRIYKPEERREKSVSLKECTFGDDGIIHSHVSVSQLRNPEHSLPDITNVILEGAEASVVVGTETHDVMLAPEDREMARLELEDALGMEMGSTSQMVEAIRSRQIRDTADARRRIRDRLPELFVVVPSDLTSYTEEIESLSISGSIPAMHPLDASHQPYEHGSIISEQIERRRVKRDQNKDMVVETAEAIAQELTPKNLVTIAVVSAITGIMADSIRRQIEG